MKHSLKFLPVTLGNDSEAASLEAVNRLRHRVRRVADQQSLQDSVDELTAIVARGRANRFSDAKRRILDDQLAVLALNATIRKLVGAELSEAHKGYLRAIGSDTTPGSTYVVDRIGGDLYDVIAEHGAWATLGVRPVRSKTGKFPVTTAVPNAQFVSEGNPMNDDTAMTGGSVSAAVAAVGILLNVSNQLAEDLEADIAMDFLEKFERGFNARVDHAVFSGTGADDGDNGETTGLFIDTNIPSVVAATGNTTAQTLELEDFLKVLDAAPAGVIQRGAAWWMHPSILVKAMRVNDASGASIVHVEPGPEGPAFYILGYPVHPVAAAPSANSANKTIAIFGEPGGYLVGVRQAFELEASSHLRWDHFQRSYRGVGRIRGVLRDATAFVALKTATT